MHEMNQLVHSVHFPLCAHQLHSEPFDFLHVSPDESEDMVLLLFEDEFDFANGEIDSLVLH